MRKMLLLLLCAALLGAMLGGCRRNDSNPTDGTTQMPTPSTDDFVPTDSMPTGTANSQSAKILGDIWAQYAEDERFTCYGGTVESAVNDGPGDLDMKAKDELTSKYLIPEERLYELSEGASLVHMMNSNIFTAVVVKITDDGTPEDLASGWRDRIQSNQWICGQPDRLILVRVDDSHLLMAFGAADVMTVFRGHLLEALEGASTLYDETVTG